MEAQATIMQGNTIYPFIVLNYRRTGKQRSNRRRKGSGRASVSAAKIAAGIEPRKHFNRRIHHGHRRNPADTEDRRKAERFYRPIAGTAPDGRRTGLVSIRVESTSRSEEKSKIITKMERDQG